MQSSGLWTLWMLHVSMCPVRRCLATLPRSLCHALCKHVSPHCLCLTATRIYQAAFIAMMTLPAKTLPATTRLASLIRPWQDEAARISSCSCSVAHDLFLPRSADISNAICVSHRLYSLHVSFFSYSFPFLFFLGYFWHVAASACLADFPCIRKQSSLPCCLPSLFLFCPNKSHW